MSTPEHSTAPATAGKGLRLAGTILLILGAVITLACVGAGAALAAVGFKDAADNFHEIQTASTPINGTGVVTLQANDQRNLYAHSMTTASSGSSLTPAPACTVTDPAGADVPLSTNTTISVTDNNEQLASFASFTAGQTGTYTIRCSGNQAVRLGKPLPMGQILSGVGGVLLAVLGGGFGFTLLIIGLVLYLVGRSRRKKAAVSTEFPPGGGPTPPAYSAAPHGAPSQQ